MSEEITPKSAPALNIPPALQCCDVSIINTTLDLTVPAEFFAKGLIRGHEMWNMPTFCFHIRHGASGKEAMFDIGGRKDWENYPPAVDHSVRNVIPGLNIKYTVKEILERGGVNVDNITSIIWSHWHYDHIGDITQYPTDIELVVGPDFKESFLPGYPESPDSPMAAADFRDRRVRQMDFTSSDLKIGQFRAHDFYNDGSFYILDVPGHAIGHISALVRTTPDTFVFLGGDICHFAGMHRPSPYLPLPLQIPADTPFDPPFSAPCPCSLFTRHRTAQGDPRTTPFYGVTEMQGSWYAEPPVALASIEKMYEFDADPNVFVMLSHDEKLIDVCDWFPHGTVNQWKAKGWKEKMRWAFLNQFPDGEGKPTRGWLAKGLMKDGKQIVKPADKWTRVASFGVYPEDARPSYSHKSGV